MNLLDRVETLGKDLREYVDLRKDHLMLTMTSRVTSVSSRLITYAILAAVAMPALFFASFALAWWLGEYWQSMPLGFLGVAGIYLLIGIIAYTLRTSLITNTIVKNITDALYDDDDKPNK